MHKKGREVAPVLFFCASVPVRVGAAAFGPARAQTVPPAAGLPVLSGFGARASAPTAFLPAQTARRQAALGRASALAKACPKSPNKPASPPRCGETPPAARQLAPCRHNGGSASQSGARLCSGRAGAGCFRFAGRQSSPHNSALAARCAVRLSEQRRSRRISANGDAQNACTVFTGFPPRGRLPDFVRQSAAKRQGISAA